MPAPLSAAELATRPLPDWRYLLGRIEATFRCPSFGAAGELVAQIAAASASASSRFVDRMWKASRCAVRDPIPGKRVSCATRFSTDGLSTN